VRGYLYESCKFDVFRNYSEAVTLSRGQSRERCLYTSPLPTSARNVRTGSLALLNFRRRGVPLGQQSF
jgi:hypothetical protein